MLKSSDYLFEFDSAMDRVEKAENDLSLMQNLLTDCSIYLNAYKDAMRQEGTEVTPSRVLEYESRAWKLLYFNQTILYERLERVCDVHEFTEDMISRGFIRDIQKLIAHYKVSINSDIPVLDGTKEAFKQVISDLEYILKERGANDEAC